MDAISVKSWLKAHYTKPVNAINYLDFISNNYSYKLCQILLIYKRYNCEIYIIENNWRTSFQQFSIHNHATTMYSCYTLISVFFVHYIIMSYYNI